MNCEAEHYYARGKFLISGEYLVLAGAEALVLPLNKGQWLHASARRSPGLYWTWRYQNETRFEAQYHPESFQIVKASDLERAQYIQRLLREASRLTPVAEKLKYCHISTETEFHPLWGMGSSSTLTVNLSRLLDIQPFDLHQAISKGSGFDVAAAMANQPFIYRKTEKNRYIAPKTLPQLFYDHAFFVWMKKKTRSEKAIQSFKFSRKKLKMPIKYINEITAQYTEVETVKELSRITSEHEEFMSEVLKTPSPANQFSDYPYGIKSLGAWGGDFIMAIHPGEKKEVEKYFNHKGYPLVFQAKELKPL